MSYNKESTQFLEDEQVVGVIGKNFMKEQTSLFDE